MASMGVALWALSSCHSEWIIIQMNYWCRGETRTAAGGEGEGKGRGEEAAAEEKAPLEEEEKGHQCELLLDCESALHFVIPWRRCGVVSPIKMPGRTLCSDFLH